VASVQKHAHNKCPILHSPSKGSEGLANKPVEACWRPAPRSARSPSCYYTPLNGMIIIMIMIRNGAENPNHFKTNIFFFKFIFSMNL